MKMKPFYLFLLGVVLVTLACGVQAPQLPPVSYPVYDVRYSPPVAVVLIQDSIFTPEPAVSRLLEASKGGELQKWRMP